MNTWQIRSSVYRTRRPARPVSHLVFGIVVMLASVIAGFAYFVG